MSLDLPADALVAYLLALVRASAWIAVVPPFGGRSIPKQAKTAIAAGLAFAAAPHLRGDLPALDLGPLVGAVLIQAAAGLALGFVTLVLFSAVAAAGDLVDLFGGLTMSSAYDPLSMQQNSVFGRLHNLLATTLLFTSGGHLVLVRGMLNSYRAVGVSGDNPLNVLMQVVSHNLGTFFVAALQIAAPLVAVLVLTDIGLGVLTKAAPTLNVFSLGFPLKILVTVTLVGATFVALPGAMNNLLDKITQSTSAVASVFVSGGG